MKLAELLTQVARCAFWLGAAAAAWALAYQIWQLKLGP